MWLKFTKFIIISYLSNAVSAKLFENDVNELKQNLINNDIVINDNLKGLNRVLVKRLIPHSEHSDGGLEYDKKFKYFYRPLVKFHVGNPRNNKDFDLDYNGAFTDDSVDTKRNKQSTKLKPDVVNELLKFFSAKDKDIFREDDQNKALGDVRSDKKNKQSKNLNNDGVSELLKLLREAGKGIFKANGQNDYVDDTRGEKKKKYSKTIQFDEVRDLIELLKGENIFRLDGYKESDTRSVKKRSKSNNNEVIDLSKLLRSDTGNDVNKYMKFKKLAHSLIDSVYGGQSKSKKLWENVENKVKNVENKAEFYKKLIILLTRALRRPPPMFSGEEGGSDDLQYSIFSLQETAGQTEKPKMKLPHYPYWNYWTYKKNLHHDNCRNGWVRFHNMCIELPPHRK